MRRTPDLEVPPSEPITNQQLLDALAWCAHEAYGAALCGRPSAVQQALVQWMNNPPRVGDLVMETSTIWYPNRIGAVGRFIKCELLKSCNCEREDVNLVTCPIHPPDADERSTRGEHYVWIGTPDPAHRHRWYNASFNRIPSTAHDHEEIRALSTEIYENENVVRVPKPCCEHGYRGGY